MRRLSVSLSIVILILGAVFYAVNTSANKDSRKAQDRTDMPEYWPAGDWRTSTPEEQGMDSGILAEMINSIKEDGKSVNSITIIRNGYLVSEAYFYPYQKGLMHFMNSGTKSFVSALVGMCMDEGHIKSVSDKVLDHFPDQNAASVDQRKRNLEIRNLLTMTTGLDWDFVTNASTNRMLQSQDWARFTLDQPMKEEPGRTFLYCNGAAHLLSAIVQNASGKSLAELAKDRFKPMGINEMYWSPSPENASNGYTGLYMLPDDAAKFGYLYLKKGNWNGKQIIPEKWVEESTKMHVKADWTPLFPGYGYMWWINRFGGYAALGQGGDYIFVVPNLDLIVVFTGGIYNLNDMFYPAELMDRYIVPSVKSDAPLQVNPLALEALKEAVHMVQNAPSPEPLISVPEIAKKTSGKPFAMDDSTTLTFEFKDGNTCIIDQDSRCVFPVGLDNVYRIVCSGNPFGGMLDRPHLASKGRWLNEDTFEVTLRDLEEGFEAQYVARFVDEHLEITIESNIYPEKTMNGNLEE